MKINQFIVVIVCCVFLISCDSSKPEKPEPVETENTETATPEILVKEKPSSRLDVSVSREKPYYEHDIISKLYQEALEKNATLETLKDKSGRIQFVQNDSLEAFNNYKSQNENYWKITKIYIAQIEDETLKASTKKSFEDLEAVFYNKIAAHEEAKSTIQQKAKELQDRLVIMKLMITHSMMNNYQNNELPDIASMKGLIKEYDKLIQEAKQLSK